MAAAGAAERSGPNRPAEGRTMSWNASGGGRRAVVLAAATLLVAGLARWPLALEASADEQPPGAAVPARIAYAGTLHRSLGVTADPRPNQPNHSDPLYG